MWTQSSIVRDLSRGSNAKTFSQMSIMEMQFIYCLRTNVEMNGRRVFPSVNIKPKKPTKIKEKEKGFL